MTSMSLAEIVEPVGAISWICGARAESCVVWRLLELLDVDGLGAGIASGVRTGLVI